MHGIFGQAIAAFASPPRPLAHALGEEGGPVDESVDDASDPRRGREGLVHREHHEHPDVTLLGAGAGSSLAVTFRAENLFDERYETVVGFPGRGRTLLGGLRATVRLPSA